MKPNLKLLAITGSHRKDGNSYVLAKTVLDSVNVSYDIVQLSEKNLEFCDLCEGCVDKDCILKDDFEDIVAKMTEADGIVFVVPKYLFFPSKFLCFLERLDTVDHIRKHKGYERSFQNADYRLFPDKPFCVLALSGTGEIEPAMLKVLEEYIESPGLKHVPHDKPPFYGVSVKSGDRKGEVLENRKGLDESRILVEKLMASI